MLGKCEGKRRRGQQRTRWLDSVIEATNMNLVQLQEAVEDRRAWRALVHGVTKSRTWLNNNYFKICTTAYKLACANIRQIGSLFCFLTCWCLSCLDLSSHSTMAWFRIRHFNSFIQSGKIICKNVQICLNLLLLEPMVKCLFPPPVAILVTGSLVPTEHLTDRQAWAKQSGKVSAIKEVCPDRMHCN